MPAKKPRHQLTKVNLPNLGELKMYFSPKVTYALTEVTEDMAIVQGVRLGTLLEAVYSQGLKDGARRVFEGMDNLSNNLKKAIPHRNPGKPNKKRTTTNRD